jgi:rfaE bifunctional protein kinase chain/domain
LRIFAAEDLFLRLSAGIDLAGTRRTISRMNRARLEEILNRLPSLGVAVVGDFCVDRYLHVDPGIREPSRETGLVVHQVVASRSLPGGAASVLADLAALGVGRVVPVGLVGEDGAGFELRRSLEAAGVDLSRLGRSATRPTPTYIKPVIFEEPGRPPRELRRFDVFPREALAPGEERRILAAAAAEMESCAALVISDYGEVGKQGTVTAAVRTGLLELAAARPGKVVFADSRLRIGEFPGCCIKPNAREAAGLLGGSLAEDSPLEELRDAAARLAERTGQPVFLTLGERGLIAADGREVRHLPGLAPPGPIDPVGAGDAVTAAAAAALAAGASAAEAGLLGLLAASVTVEKIGECGTASPDEVRARFADYGRAHPAAAGEGAAR